MSEEEVKPSERINQIVKDMDWKGNEYITLVPAIIQYLDEQHDERFAFPKPITPNP